MSRPVSAVSQMLERNQALFFGKQLLVCGALEVGALILEQENEDLRARVRELESRDREGQRG